MSLTSLQQLLSARRLHYAYILASAMWLAWFISVLAGPGVFDLTGHPVGADYLAFYTGGYSSRSGLSAFLYDFSHQHELQTAIVGSQLDSLYAYIAPPHLSWLYMPLSWLPYGASFALWALLCLVFLILALQLLGATGRSPALWALTWYATYTSISFGQTSLLSLFLLSLTYFLWRRRLTFAAGLALSLLMYKPQLAVGVGILWLVDFRRDYLALLGLALGSAVTAALSFIFMPDASRAYIVFARDFLPNLNKVPGFPLWNQHSVRGFWHLLLPSAPNIADTLTTLVGVVAVVAFLAFLRLTKESPALRFGAAVCLTLALTPHALIYELVLLLIPAVLFWYSNPSAQPVLIPVYSLYWCVTLFGPSLAFVQQRYLPFVLQITVPALFVMYAILWRILASRFSPVPLGN